MLNESQELFFKATLRGEKPEQAAISAGLSAKTAKAAGHRMRKHPAIVAALAAVGIQTKGAPTAKPTLDGPSEESESAADFATVEIAETDDPKVFLTSLMNCPKAGVKARLEAAKALLPYDHSKLGDKGKKETKADGAKELSGARSTYGSRKPPRLVVSNTRG
jgi:phage terminase small subunit